MQEVHVHGVFTDPITMSPVILLMVPDKTRCLPIWVSHFDAIATAIALADETAHRPLPQDLMVASLTALGVSIESVSVTGLVEDIFHGSITLVRKRERHVMDARPSDAIALSVRTGAPIFVDEAILALAGMTPDEVGIDATTLTDEDIESETKQFRSFLDDINPDDFSD